MAGKNLDPSTLIPNPTMSSLEFPADGHEGPVGTSNGSGDERTHESLHEAMKEEADRHPTFIRFPVDCSSSAGELAKNGFYSTGMYNLIKCCSCRQCVNCGKATGNPVDPSWHKPNCRFATGADCSTSSKKGGTGCQEFLMRHNPNCAATVPESQSFEFIEEVWQPGTSEIGLSIEISGIGIGVRNSFAISVRNEAVEQPFFSGAADSLPSGACEIGALGVRDNFAVLLGNEAVEKPPFSGAANSLLSETFKIGAPGVRNNFAVSLGKEDVEQSPFSGAANSLPSGTFEIGALGVRDNFAVLSGNEAVEQPPFCEVANSMPSGAFEIGFGVGINGSARSLSSGTSEIALGIIRGSSSGARISLGLQPQSREWGMANVVHYIGTCIVCLNLVRVLDRSAWPVASELIGKNGFFNVGDINRTQCFSCGGFLMNWTVIDDACVTNLLVEKNICGHDQNSQSLGEALLADVITTKKETKKNMKKARTEEISMNLVETVPTMACAGFFTELSPAIIRIPDSDATSYHGLHSGLETNDVSEESVIIIPDSDATPYYHIYSGLESYDASQQPVVRIPDSDATSYYHLYSGLETYNASQQSVVRIPDSEATWYHHGVSPRLERNCVSQEFCEVEFHSEVSTIFTPPTSDVQCSRDCGRNQNLPKGSGMCVVCGNESATPRCLAFESTCNECGCQIDNTWIREACVQCRAKVCPQCVTLSRSHVHNS